MPRSLAARRDDVLAMAFGRWPTFDLPDPAGGGASGIYVASLLERLGIAAEMKPKTKLFPPTEVLYDLVGAAEQIRRHLESELPCGLEIEQELEFGRLHHRQIGGLFALEDACDVVAELPRCILSIGRIAHQPAYPGVLVLRKARSDRMAGSERYDLLSPTTEVGIADQEQRGSALLSETGEASIDLAFRPSSQ